MKNPVIVSNLEMDTSKPVLMFGYFCNRFTMADCRFRFGYCTNEAFAVVFDIYLSLTSFGVICVTCQCGRRQK